MPKHILIPFTRDIVCFSKQMIMQAQKLPSSLFAFVRKCVIIMEQNEIIPLHIVCFLTTLAIIMAHLIYTKENYGYSDYNS